MSKLHGNFETFDSSIMNFVIKFEPSDYEIENLYISNSSAKTFEDVINEAPELLSEKEHSLRRKIKESIKENADIWSELAKY